MDRVTFYKKVWICNSLLPHVTCSVFVDCHTLRKASRCRALAILYVWRLAVNVCGLGPLKSTTFGQTVIATSSLSVCDLHQSPQCCRGNDYQLYQSRATGTRPLCRLRTHTHTHIHFVSVLITACLPGPALQSEAAWVIPAQNLTSLRGRVTCFIRYEVERRELFVPVMGSGK